MTRKMGIAIGVIGHDVLVQKIVSALKLFPNFYPMVRVYENEHEVPPLAESLKDDVEVLFFSGYRSYRRAMDCLSLNIPAHYVPLSGAGLYSALFRLQKRSSLEKLSIDSLSEAIVKQALRELGEGDSELIGFPELPSNTLEEILRFHQEQFLEKKCTGVLTGEKAVADRLSAFDVPNEWVKPTEQDIVVSLERALLSTESRRMKESQIVVGLIKINDFNRLVENTSSEHEVQKMKLDIHRVFLDYVKSLEGHLTNLGGGEYLFFTTRGIFERETRGYKYIPLLQESEKSLGLSLSIGIGFGRSANEAGTHARLALRQSKEAGGNVCYIVREDKCVIGPVEMRPPLVYDLSVTDKELLSKAEKAGMTATYMSKLLAQVNAHGKVEYTAQELAPILGVTVRSTHRILLQWLDAGVVEIVGVEKVATKGRPRQIYRLSFLNRKHAESDER